jgi:hypothetical protein
MDPKEAAKVFLNCIPQESQPVQFAVSSYMSIIEFMSFSPEAAAHILAHMSEDAIKSIALNYLFTPAVLARITPFLQKINPQLVAQLFDESLPDLRRGQDKFPIARLFDKELSEIISVFNRLEDHKRSGVLECMFFSSSAAQMQKVVQILEVLLRDGLLDCKETKNLIRRSIYCRDDYYRRNFNGITLHQALAQNLSNNMLAQLVCHLKKDEQEKFLSPFPEEKFLSPFPEERREAIQNLIGPKP